MHVTKPTYISQQFNNCSQNISVHDNLIYNIKLIIKQIYIQSIDFLGFREQHRLWKKQGETATFWNRRILAAPHVIMHSISSAKGEQVTMQGESHNAKFLSKCIFNIPSTNTLPAHEHGRETMVVVLTNLHSGTFRRINTSIQSRASYEHFKSLITVTSRRFQNINHCILSILQPSILLTTSTLSELHLS